MKRRLLLFNIYLWAFLVGFALVVAIDLGLNARAGIPLLGVGGHGGAPAIGGKLLQTDGSFILQTDGVSKICLAEGC